MLQKSRARRTFDRTKHFVENGPACRIYGSMDVKKVTGNLHVVSVAGSSVIGCQANAMGRFLRYHRFRPHYRQHWAMGTLAGSIQTILVRPMFLRRAVFENCVRSGC